MQFIKISIIGIFCFLSFGSSDSSFAPSKEEIYINEYKAIAIREMYRSGIPASIKLAQGLHESGAGKSDLALFAYNHFGIKCKTTWDGSKFFQEDDDRDRNGKLRKSCFRVYNSVEDSYKDHTAFLMYRKRYSSLFDIPKTNYTAWAKGLKRCGYATDPSYPKRLIKTIKKHKLDQYDQAPMPKLRVNIQQHSHNAYKLPKDYIPKIKHNK